MKHFFENVLTLTFGHLQFLLILPEVKICKKTRGGIEKRNRRDTYEGAPADFDADHDLVAEPEEGDKKKSKENEQRRKSEQDSRYWRNIGVSN